MQAGHFATQMKLLVEAISQAVEARGGPRHHLHDRCNGINDGKACLLDDPIVEPAEQQKRKRRRDEKSKHKAL